MTNEATMHVTDEMVRLACEAYDDRKGWLYSSSPDAMRSALEAALRAAPAVPAASAIADALEKADWSTPTIGNKALLVAAVEALRHSAPPAPVADGWRSIETAPRDGMDIILGAPPQMLEGRPVAARVTIGHWATDEECRVDIGDCGGPCRCREYEYVDPSWMSWDGGFTADNAPTHWMPLPAAPTEGGR